MPSSHLKKNTIFCFSFLKTSSTTNKSITRDTNRAMQCKTCCASITRLQMAVQLIITTCWQLPIRDNLLIESFFLYNFVLKEPFSLAELFVIERTQWDVPGSIKNWNLEKKIVDLSHWQSWDAWIRIIFYLITLNELNVNQLTDSQELPTEFHHKGNCTSKMC